jgi:hypothetical protein
MPTPTYDEIQNKLESLKKEHDRISKSQRQALYSLLQEATKMALLVEADEKFRSRFLKKKREKDVLRAALIFIFDAKSEPEKKEASKRARALRYLIDKLGIAAEDIATAISKHGGIEKMARLAAQSPDDQNEEDQDEPEEDDQDEPEDADENEDVESKFGKKVSVGLSPKQAKRLNGLADKTRIRIIGYVRVSSDESPTIEVIKFVKLKAKKISNKKPDKGDWE